MSILSGLGNVWSNPSNTSAAPSINPYGNQGGTLSNGPTVGPHLGGMQNYPSPGYLNDIIEQEIKRRNTMAVAGDIIVRPARNGYRVIVVPGNGKDPEEYVATDLDNVHEVLKLATVNQKIDAAK